MPSQPWTINLSPAELRKEGPAHDLPRAAAILILVEQNLPGRDGAILLGELSLEGSVRHVKRILPMAHLTHTQGHESIFAPLPDAPEAALVEGIDPRPWIRWVGQWLHSGTIIPSSSIAPAWTRITNQGPTHATRKTQGAGAREARTGSDSGGRAQHVHVMDDNHFGLA